LLLQFLDNQTLHAFTIDKRTNQSVMKICKQRVTSMCSPLVKHNPKFTRWTKFHRYFCEPYYKNYTNEDHDIGIDSILNNYTRFYIPDCIRNIANLATENNQINKLKWCLHFDDIDMKKLLGTSLKHKVNLDTFQFLIGHYRAKLYEIESDSFAFFIDGFALDCLMKWCELKHRQHRYEIDEKNQSFDKLNYLFSHPKLEGFWQLGDLLIKTICSKKHLEMSSIFFTYLNYFLYQLPITINYQNFILAEWNDIFITTIDSDELLVRKCKIIKLLINDSRFSSRFSLKGLVSLLISSLHAIVISSRLHHYDSIMELISFIIIKPEIIKELTANGFTDQDHKKLAEINDPKLYELLYQYIYKPCVIL